MSRGVEFSTEVVTEVVTGVSRGVAGIGLEKRHGYLVFYTKSAIYLINY